MPRPVNFVSATAGDAMRHLFPIISFLWIIISLPKPATAQTVGWFFSLPGHADGYVLFAPINSDTTYLIDKCGRKVHTWKSDFRPGQSVYLLEDGRLLRTGKAGNTKFTSGGNGGIIELFSFDGDLLWQYMISDNQKCQHHDAIMLPNGNIVAIVWESFTKDEAVAMGRNPNTMGSEIWADMLMEIQPVGPDSGIVVWHWRIWDHLVQDYDAAKPNFGVIADHPGRININLATLSMQNADWTHINAVAYNPTLDQLMLSVRNFSEIWIIDHSTTAAEAATSAGGLSGRGGDLLYRWGNPKNYNRGTSADRKLYGQHNAHWIPPGLPGTGKVLLFNNGEGRPDGNYSTVETLVLPDPVNYTYPLAANAAYDPPAPDWIYKANPPASMFSGAVSGAQRLPNGNTLICVGVPGTFLEIDSNEQVVWKYVNPVGINGIATQGSTPSNNMVFRCTYYPPDYPAFNGQPLVAGAPIEKNPLPYNCETATEEVAEAGNTALGLFPNPCSKSFVFVPGMDFVGTLELRDPAGRLIDSHYRNNWRAGLPESLTIHNYSGWLLVQVRDPNGRLLGSSKLLVH